MRISLSHGSGGRETSALIRDMFMKHFANPISAKMEDAAVLSLSGKVAFTTDSYVVEPLFFPNGDIGKLAVCGTVNDLLTSGAVAKYISASFIIEEGFELEALAKIAASMKRTADEANVLIATGDTKVIGRNSENANLYINTSGIGVIEKEPYSFENAKAGDAIIVTGNLGSHHACVLSQRLNLKNSIESDVAPLTEIMSALLSENVNVRGARDVTRGGLATILNEAVGACKLKAVIKEALLPVSEEVAGFAKILGLDPLYMGNEGVMLLFVPSGDKDKALRVIRACKYGSNAAVIGELEVGAGVELIAKLGGRRKLSALSGEGLPRIC